MSDVDIKDNFISSSDCDFIVNFHKENFTRLTSRFIKTYNKTEIIRVNHLLSEPDHCPNLIKKLIADATVHIKTIDKEAFVNYTEIVKWPEGESQDAHIDFDWHPYTSILYLNDDYKGGQTKVDDKIIQPKKGRIITFKGSKLTHEVLKITKGDRYTVPIWYSTLLTFRKNKI